MNAMLVRSRMNDASVSAIAFAFASMATADDLDVKMLATGHGLYSEELKQGW